MLNAILPKEAVFTTKSSKMGLATQKKDFSMGRNPMLDQVTAKERMGIPLAYRWLQIKSFFKAVFLKGGKI